MSTRAGGTLTLPEHAGTGLPQHFVADMTVDAADSRAGTSVSASAALRLGLTRRWSAFAGGGITLRRTTRQIQTSLTCVPRVAGGCDGRPNLDTREEVTATRTSPQLVSGVDVALNPRLAAFAELRWTGIGRTDFADDDVHLVSGVRVAMRTRSTPPELPEVVVIALDGSRRKGRLIAFSPTDVVLRRGDNTERVPLSQVRHVEAATHRVRNGALLGAISGSVLGFLAGTARGAGADMGPAGHALLSGLWGAGAGAALGGLLNLTSPRVILP
jgi:hypothetical protein